MFVSGATNTTQIVTVIDLILCDFTDNPVSKISLLEFSLKFLLEKELNTSIDASFDINVMSSDFSGYRDVIRS